MNQNDGTFITNEEGNKLLDRFRELNKHSKYLDCLVGYFYNSGFHSIYKSLEDVKKIRILIGISTNKDTYDLIEQGYLSSKQIDEQYEKTLIKETEKLEDSDEIESGVRKFIEWIRIGKLIIHAYPNENIHAKLYIMTFKDGSLDRGRVITGSSNLTMSGLKDNLEFNVVLTRPEDYDFAIKKFNDLWGNSIDISEKCVETIKKKTWLNDNIMPYELYLKFLYEYLKDKINNDQSDEFDNHLPENFMNLQYQKDAIQDAKSKLEEYGGVFISDVVGLGKTIVGTMLAQKLNGRTLIIAPPALIDEDNPGSWPNVFLEFGVRQSRFESSGMLDRVLEGDHAKFDTIIIDESHRFRNEMTQQYEKLFELCKGKKVILISATPLNNTPLDILAQLKLFQDGHKSTLPNPQVRDLDKYFKGLQQKLKHLDRQTDKEEYLQVVSENAEDIRENVLQYLMIRRTRNSITKYYAKDLTTQNLKFPKVENPEPIIYNFDDNLDAIFNETIELIVKNFKYARYTSLLYLNEKISQPEEISQKNMRRFMKILLLKRLESSFYAFKTSVERSIESHKRFIEEYEKGRVFISKKHMSRIFELLENDDEESVTDLIEQNDAIQYNADDFNENLISDLNYDYNLLNKIHDMWKTVKIDPKLHKFIHLLKNDDIFKKHKLLVFTESKETSEYLEKELRHIFGNQVMSYSSKSSRNDRNKIIKNYDANYTAEKQEDDIKILISTDILSEGMSLHRSNVVINYDIPWNPIRMMQRVGRVNRVGKNLLYQNIYTYNFFPAGSINENIGLKEAAESKIKAFIEMLGNDARLLTNEDIKSHDLFLKLSSASFIVGHDEEDPELKYLTLLRNIRDNDKNLFRQIQQLPKKARTAKKYGATSDSTITFFRKGKLRKIFQTDGISAKEIDFSTAAKILAVKKNTKKEILLKDFYKYLEINKKEFNAVFVNNGDFTNRGSKNYELKLSQIIKAISNSSEFTADDVEYLKNVLNLLKIGGIPKNTIKNLIKKIEKISDPITILDHIRIALPSALFLTNSIKNTANIKGPQEIILSECLLGD